MNARDLPFKVRIASPCHARWEEMGGGDRVRFCNRCRKNVYNLSSMTTAEATALLAGKGDLCARVFQRADGTVLTEDCPVGVARYWARVKVIAAGGVVAIVLAFAYVKALGRDRGAGSENFRRLQIEADAAIWKIKDRLGLNPPVMLGKICPASSVTAPPQAPTQTQSPAAAANDPSKR